MEMGAITRQYTNAEAAVGTLQAGADIVLGPQNFVEAFDAVVKAVENGTLSEQRIDQSVRRILRLKKTNRQIDETPSWNDQRPVLKGCEVRGKGC